jgi:hypothetical protein
MYLSRTNPTMKTRSLIGSLVVCALALGMVSPLTAQSLKQGAAKVIRIKGAGRYTTGDGVVRPLKVGDVLKAGTVIQTSKNKGDYIDIALGDSDAAVPMTSAGPKSDSPKLLYQPNADQNIVRIWESSVLGVDKLTTMETGADVVTETQLDLQQGHIFGTVKKMSAASRYEVKMPNGIAGIRGTTFDIWAYGLIRVSVGSAVDAYVGADGSAVTQVIMGGQQFDARTGQLTPIPPGELQSMENAAGSARAGGGGGILTPTSFVEDHTIYWVSPIHHHHNDNDNDGDNDSHDGDSDHDSHHGHIGHGD